MRFKTSVESIQQVFHSLAGYDIYLMEKVLPFNSGYLGKFAIITTGSTTYITFYIPPGFPHKDILFYYRDGVGIPHQNRDGRICLITGLYEDPSSQLAESLLSVKEWVLTYLVGKSFDSQYEYPFIHPISADPIIDVLFNSGDEFSKEVYGSFGKFAYRKIRDQSSSKLYLIQSIGEITTLWGPAYIGSKYKTGIGFWVHLEDAPLANPKLLESDLEKLLYHFPNDAMSKIEYYLKAGLSQYLIRTKGSNGYLPILIGFPVPNGDKFESHWECLLLRSELIKARLNRGNKGILTSIKGSAEWARTFNIATKRYFGRGELSEKLARKRILILGCGAIGSNLSVILVRCGCINITLSDPDIVEPGNICRSEFSIPDVGLHKVVQLADKLYDISPYVDVSFFESVKSPGLNFYTMDSSEWKYQLDVLNGFDLIFDCSAEVRVASYLDGMGLNTSVISLAITNKAEDMLVISNHDRKHISIKRFELVNSLGKGAMTASYYEGTGCWNPTFEAATFHIDALLNLALSKIDAHYRDGTPVSDFWLSYDNGGIQLNNC